MCIAESWLIIVSFRIGIVSLSKMHQQKEYPTDDRNTHVSFHFSAGADAYRTPLSFLDMDRCIDLLPYQSRHWRLN